MMLRFMKASSPLWTSTAELDTADAIGDGS